MCALAATAGTRELEVEEAVLADRAAAAAPIEPGTVGRVLFATNRRAVGDAEHGASTLFTN